jgi:hypothetical protein
MNFNVGLHEAPARLGKLEHVKRLALGLDFGCALLETGELYQWGEYSYGGVRHFGKVTKQDVTLSIKPDMRVRSEDAPEVLPDKRMNVALTRVAQGFDVRDLVVSGHHTCLRLDHGPLLCEWLLGHMPFDIREVWPWVQFEPGDGTVPAAGLTTP